MVVISTSLQCVYANSMTGIIIKYVVNKTTDKYTGPVYF